MAGKEKFHQLITSKAGYKALCDAASDAIFIIDPKDAAILDANQYAVNLTGFSKKELCSMKIEQLAIREDFPYFQKIMEEYAKTGEMKQIMETHLRTRQGNVISVEITNRVVTIDSVKVGIAIVRDISERKKLEEERAQRAHDLEILNTVILEITSKLDLKNLLPKIVQDAVNLLGADAGAIALWDEQKRIMTYPFLYNLPGTPLAIETERKGLAMDVIRKKQPIIISDYTGYPHRLPQFVEAGVKSTLAVPLLIGDTSFGALGVFYLNKLKKFNGWDLRLLQAVGRQAAIAIENSRLFEATKKAYEQERYLANTLQLSLLPEEIPKLENTDVGAYYLSAAKEAYVGGDFYDFVPTDNLIGIVIGDISGKGIEVASMTAMAKHVIRTLLFQELKPAEIMTVANKIIYDQIKEGFFVVLSFYCYDYTTGEIAFVNAGQQHAYFCYRGKKCFQLETWDPALGIIRDYHFNQNNIQLSQGDVLLAYTDGLVEVRRDEVFFETQLHGLIEKYAHLPAQQITDRIIADCKEFAQGELPDDIVVVTLKRQ